jgi:hypothetical protein
VVRGGKVAITIVQVEEVLKSQTPALEIHPLHALAPTRDPYRVLLLQPEAKIQADVTRVGNADSGFADAVCRSFLETAMATKADLAVAPEYCVPWALVNEISAGKLLPDVGALWVLGCESIDPASLGAFAKEVNETPGCLMLYEPLSDRQVIQKRYLDPLLYVFWTRTHEGKSTLALIVQFKTVPCKDYREIEQKSLCLGSVIYAFNRGNGKIGLMSIICSDAFDFTSLVEQHHRDALLIHIQLNPKPAHVDYAAYRTRLCSVGSNSDVELLCLNWARDVRERKPDGSFANWKNVAGSAWYAPPSKFNGDPETVDSLHAKGLYYSVLCKRWHSLFLNYEPQMLLLQKQKLFFLGEQALLPKNWMEVEGRWSWDSEGKAWVSAAADDGFNDVVAPYTAVAAALMQARLRSPVGVERALELLVGPKGKPTTWYQLQELASMHLHPDEESMCRITVHQERDPSRPGVAYRKMRLQRAQDAVGLPGQQVPWPAPLRDLDGGFSLEWAATSPFHNATPMSGGRGPAAVIYLSDEADDAVVDTAFDKARTGLIAHATGESAGKSASDVMNALVRAQDRMCVVYRRGGQYLVRGADSMVAIDRPAGESPVDITGA